MSHTPDAADDIDIYESGIVLPYHDAPGDEQDAHADAIASMEADTLRIANTLAGCGVHPALCASVEHQVRLVWTNAMRTVADE